MEGTHFLNDHLFFSTKQRLDYSTGIFISNTCFLFCGGPTRFLSWNKIVHCLCFVACCPKACLVLEKDKWYQRCFSDCDAYAYSKNVFTWKSSHTSRRGWRFLPSGLLLCGSLFVCTFLLFHKHYRHKFLLCFHFCSSLIWPFHQVHESFLRNQTKRGQLFLQALPHLCEPGQCFLWPDYILFLACDFELGYLQVLHHQHFLG